MHDLPQHTPAHRPQVSAKEFLDASMVFCDNYALLNALPRSEQEKPLFAGMLGTRTLSTGINLSTAQITALSDSRHSAIFPRSLSFVLSLEGRPSEFDRGGSGKKVILRPGEAALFSFSDDSNTEGRYLCGQRCKSVLIQLRPGMIADDQLAEFVELRSRNGEMTSIGENARLNLLCAQLFNSDLTGAVGRLLIESYVLEVVARAIQVTDNERSDLPTTAKNPDRIKMARVRDKMVAEPGEDHSLTSLAREAGVSVSSLKIKFREVYGQSVFAFLQDMRMKRAKTGLEVEGWTVTKAAHFAGYRHVSNFSTAFQRHFGRPPSRPVCAEIYPLA